jgi:excisionase family DNA binding protein
MPPAPAYLTIDEVAELCRVTDRTVRNWINSGRLTAYKMGPQAVRIAVEDVAGMFKVKPVTKS